jgi:hypothetical protein
VKNRRPLDWGWVLGLFIAAFGLGFVWLAVAENAPTDRDDAGLLAGVGLTFALLGVVVVTVSARENRKTMDRNRRARAFPDEPWRWRADWDALRVTARSRRFGTTTLELQTLPGPIGGELVAALIPSFKDRPIGGLQVTLAAVRHYYRGGGKQRRRIEEVRWRGSTTAPVEATTTGARAQCVIKIPGDAPETDDRNPGDEIVWTLTAEADLHGRQFRAAFVVPVFRRERGAALHRI